MNSIIQSSSPDQTSSAGYVLLPSHPISITSVTQIIGMQLFSFLFLEGESVAIDLRLYKHLVVVQSTRNYVYLISSKLPTVFLP